MRWCINAFWRPGSGFRGSEGDVVEFSRVNILGTLQLIESSIKAGVERFVFVSTCAVHEKILDDRPLDEAHPLWPLTHYGAHKAAVEKFVHSYGFGNGYPICFAATFGRLWGQGFCRVVQVVSNGAKNCDRGDCSCPWWR